MTTRSMFLRGLTLVAGCALLADGFEQAIPRLVEGAAYTVLRVDAAGIGDTGQLELGGVLLSSGILPLLRACNGTRTVAEVIATQSSREDAPQAIRSLVELGILTLTRSDVA